MSPISPISCNHPLLSYSQEFLPRLHIYSNVLTILIGVAFIYAGSLTETVLVADMLTFLGSDDSVNNLFIMPSGDLKHGLHFEEQIEALSCIADEYYIVYMMTGKNSSIVLSLAVSYFYLSLTKYAMVLTL